MSDVNCAPDFIGLLLLVYNHGRFISLYAPMIVPGCQNSSYSCSRMVAKRVF